MNWPKYRLVERQARRMHDVMEQLDVDPARLARIEEGELYARMRQRCLECAFAEECLNWLDSEDRLTRPGFCPNLPVFQACRRRTTHL
jgi:hypothetical protein